MGVTRDKYGLVLYVLPINSLRRTNAIWGRVFGLHVVVFMVVREFLSTWNAYGSTNMEWLWLVFST